MMSASPFAVDQLTENLRAIRYYFRTGGSDWHTLLVLLVIAGLVALTCVLTARQRKAREHRKPADPRRLFHDLLKKLVLPTRQRQLLDTVARDLHLASPATILLSPAVLDRRIAEWQLRQVKRTVSAASDASASDVASQVRDSLFPNH